MLPIGESDGALLLWTFDRLPGTTQFLVVRLTEAEADRVHSADPYAVGLIEPVRRRIKNRWALLIVRCGEKVYGLPYRIPRWRSEKFFIADLDAAAASCPAYRMAHSREIAKEAQVLAETLVRDLVPA